MSNRGEDLESQIAELQAAVDGLTEELVETKERVRQLEETTDALEADDSEPEGQTTAEQQAEARGAERRDAEFVAEGDDGADEAAAEEEESDDDDGDDIIVA